MNTDRSPRPEQKLISPENPLNVTGPSIRRAQYFWFVGRTAAWPNGEFSKSFQLVDAERDSRRLSPAFTTLVAMWEWVNQNTKYWWRASFLGGGQNYIQLPGDPQPAESENDKGHWECWSYSSTFQDMRKCLSSRMRLLARAYEQEQRYMRNRRSRY